MLSDAFESNGIYVYYKNPGLCNAIEIAPPSEPTFHGKTILGLPYREAREIVNLIDPKFKEDGSGLIATSLGIGLYAPGAAKDIESKVESVIVFEMGYYD